MIPDSLNVELLNISQKLENRKQIAQKIQEAINRKLELTEF